ncbi:MAG: DUF3466 family protein [Nostoc sp. CmiVER01]|uniref:DUF3466 family protein n=1 Tax=Nostoc sp. CmiVER01 TaxID=3075384 RepID=UPI002AD582FD|nr:DUF3466 family protein [Nostoc sp. CmiVER01]MDZ8126653.1 DUF3466 family protein [Nostoc sp. CmiVER01]
MESPDAFLINNVSSYSLDGGLTKSLLDSASLSSALDNNSSKTASVSFGFDHLSISDTAVASPQPDFLDNDNSLLFQQSTLTASVPSKPLTGSNITNYSTTNFDPLTGRRHFASLVNIPSNDSLSDSLISVGKFGDFDGHQDFQLAITDALGNPETFSLSGDGIGEVFRNSSFEQIIFTGTNASTIVQISAFNNIKFGNYTGSSLQVQTKGSISAGNITLKNTASSSNPGLNLQSGLSGIQNSIGSYTVTDLGTLPGRSYSSVSDINDFGQVVGSSYGIGNFSHAFLYNDGQMTDLGTLPGQNFSDATAINNSGQIVGSSGYYGHAFLYSDSHLTDLGTINGFSSAKAINNSGQIVGSSYGNDGFLHTFLYSDGKMTDLGTFGGRYSNVNAINDSVQIVGQFQTNEYKRHAFLYSDGKTIDLGTLGGSFSNANAINNSGQIVGSSDRNDYSTHAFLYSDGKMVDLGTPFGDSQSYGYDINDSGQVVGFSENDNGLEHAFLYSDGHMTDLNGLIPKESGWTLEGAIAINNKAQIVGYGSIGEQDHAFLLNPISTTATPKDGITVGNISTQGGSVFLQGLKINLTGSNVVTKGGNITFDGPTILNSSTGAYTFNSAKSTVTSKGGDITFKNTLDSNSAGASSLSLTGGLGNITFNNAVGGHASLKDLTVNSTKTFTANGDITSQGNITLNAIDDITTASLSTADSGNVNISLGKIGDKKYDSKGDVTTGNITAKQVDILSDGAFRTQGDIQTKDGDVNITALKDVVVHNITSTNAGISLISATKAITATGEIIGDYGVTALAKQNITTEKIKSANDVVLLNSSQGAVTVNGAITSNSDVSLGAFKDVVTQDITSLDGAVALISSSGNVKAQGAIASVDNVTLGATQDVLAQNIVSAFGTVALVSSKGSVTTTDINSGSQVAIQADQNVTTDKISSQWGKVALIAKQGTVTTQGDITTNNGDIYLSSVGNVISQNIISNGGVIAIASSQGAVTTGYLRSDGNNTGGKIYVQADGSVRVTGSVQINNANYSIYTGVKKKGLISIAYDSGVLKSNKSKFLIGDASINGTAAGIYGPYAFDDEGIIPKLIKSTGVLLYQVIEEIFKGNDNQPTKDPSNAADTNPITGKAYGSNKKERELVEQLNTAQQRRLNVLIHNKNNPERITEQEVFTKGKVDSDHGCFNLELDRHLGGYEDHDDYATWVTGSKGDFLVIARNSFANFAFYDGIVKNQGKAFLLNEQPLGSVAEVKTAQYFLIKAENRQQLTPEERYKQVELEKEIYYRHLVAKLCELKFFISFDNQKVAIAASRLYETTYPDVDIMYILPRRPADV